MRGALAPVLFNPRDFSLDAFMARQEAGFWMDLTRPDTMLQESVGPTPADASGEPIGLALSQRLWGGQTRAGYLAGQPDLQSGAFGVPASNDNVITAQDASSFATTGVTTAARVFKNLVPTVAGRVYQLRQRVVSASATVTLFARAGLGGAGTILLTATPAFGQISETYFVATGTETNILWSTSVLGDFSVDSISVREVSQVPATQSTSADRPLFQPYGATFNGTSQNLLTNYTAGSGANTLIAKVVVPASIAEFQYMLGALGAEADNRFALGINTDGTAGFAWGATSPVTAKGTTDLRGQTVIIGVTADGTSVRGFVNSTQEYSASASGVATTTIPLRLGCWNANGTADNFFGGSIEHAIAYRGGELLDLKTFNNIAAALSPTYNEYLSMDFT